jgi:hypothetical protein
MKNNHGGNTLAAAAAVGRRRGDYVRHAVQERQRRGERIGLTMKSRRIRRGIAIAGAGARVRREGFRVD